MGMVPVERAERPRRDVCLVREKRERDYVEGGVDDCRTFGI